ncbi:helix-turn-helix domain-containing protein [Geminicoccaceae bacterium 1502E]|nr:helix-turn-helix domain-containing protein [Geminicoccaceae bacterium 1502E]
MSLDEWKPGGAGCAKALCEECEVRGLSVCGALRSTELPALAAIASGRRLEPGQTLFHEGDPAEDVFTVTGGALKLFKLMSDGRRQITGYLLPGDFLGLAYGSTYVFGAEAISGTTLCRFPRRQFLRLLDEFPALEHELLGRASSELAAAQEQMLLLGRKTARERVASFVLQLAGRVGSEHDASLALPLNRTDIADYLGLTIETVSRTFTLLRKEGLIGLPDKQQVRLLAREALQEAAGI